MPTDPETVAATLAACDAAYAETQIEWPFWSEWLSDAIVALVNGYPVLREELERLRKTCTRYGELVERIEKWGAERLIPGTPWVGREQAWKELRALLPTRPEETT